MNSHDIRTKFFDFFTKKMHEQVASSSLIPAQDPTLLFTNAGMNQFKDLFLGLEKRSYARAVTIQKCVRAGGKHNDLENVGFTKRHLTFFEMMGNFSFGDYFKKEAISFAWEFLTKEIGLPEEKLHATVFETDDEAYNIWHTIVGLPKEKIHRLGADTNFWAMGDLGPCGPCTEIFIDRGVAYGKPDDTPASDSERFLEIWNLVFMQFDRQADGALKPLKQTGVDTGMGLERLCLVTQQKDSVFQTDLFANIIKQTEALSGLSYKDQQPQVQAAFHVLADHIRSTTLLIADGCAPSNEGRGYVLRKIIRRAAKFAQKLTDKNIFPELALIVINDLKAFYPELVRSKDIIYTTLSNEIQKFSANLARGTVLLEQLFAKEKTSKMISGVDAFKLYDTYGFPPELISAEARERGFAVDDVAFAQEMAKQKAQSGQKEADLLSHFELPEQVISEFTGYQELETTSNIVALIVDNQLVDAVAAGTECYVITQKSPFFIVGGGQVPDQGWVVHGDVAMPTLQARYINGVIALKLVAQVALKVGDTVTEKVDPVWRNKAMRNHTATHLLQAALIELFGNQIKQSGSLVHPDYLRFDFSYAGDITADDLVRIEKLVNEKIMANIPVQTAFMTLKEATAQGALAFFGDKYKPEKVRMVKVDDFSIELCGGTHVHATGQIGTLKITELSSPAAGYKRIVAVSGVGALQLFQETFTTMKHLSTEFKVKLSEVFGAVAKQKAEIKQLQAGLKSLRHALMKASVSEWTSHVIMIGSIPFGFIKTVDMDATELHDIIALVNAHTKGFYFVTNHKDAQMTFVCSIDQQFAPRIDMNALAAWLKTEYELRGGVQKNSVQGGGKQLPADFEKQLSAWIAKNAK